ncbi:SWIM zinc finger family protein [Candidatus Woesearchaeota archaeon]|nr:SWIM zinc finger family protein [Candidatus Woesearchaeota archaeon]
MGIQKQPDGTFQVESSKKGKFYTVDLSKGSCTCPFFRFSLQRVHGECKHILAVKDMAQGRDQKSYEGIISFVKKHQPVESISLIKEFGEDAVDDLLSRGELIEKDGMIKILE